MSKWLVVLGFDEEREAREFASSVRVTGAVEVAVGGTWQTAPATVELGPYLEEGQP